MNKRASWFTAKSLQADTPPAPQHVIEPVLTPGAIHLLHGPPGIGKSLLALGLAHAASTGGGLLGWRAPRRHKVALLDGQTGAAEFRRRLDLFGQAPSLLHVWLTAEDRQPPPDLHTSAGCRRVVEQWDNPEVTIIDACETFAGRRNGDPRQRDSFCRFLATARRARRAVLLVATTRQTVACCERLLDVVLELRRPARAVVADGACFELHVAKAHAPGAAFEPMLVRLATPAGAIAEWHGEPAALPLIDRAVAVMRRGHKPPQAAVMLGVSRAWAYRLREQAEDLGLLPALPKRRRPT